jgi:hypothetical protein
MTVKSSSLKGSIIPVTTNKNKTRQRVVGAFGNTAGSSKKKADE